MSRRTNCFCGGAKISGECEYGCSPFADPDWLRLQTDKRRERDAHRRREERIVITQDDLQRIRRAVRRFDPIARHLSSQGKRAALKRYWAGGPR